jgi:predicted transcriptional regulator
MDYNRHSKLMEQILFELSELNGKLDLNDKWRIAATLGVSPQTVYNYTGSKKGYLPKTALGEKILEQAHIIIKEKEDKLKNT